MRKKSTSRAKTTIKEATTKATEAVKETVEKTTVKAAEVIEEAKDAASDIAKAPVVEEAKETVNAYEPDRYRVRVDTLLVCSLRICVLIEISTTNTICQCPSCKFFNFFNHNSLVLFVSGFCACTKICLRKCTKGAPLYEQK